MQDQLFQLVDQHPAGPLDHALGKSRGARGIHDVKGMVERQLDEIDLQAVFGRAEVRKGHGMGDAGDIRPVRGVGHDDEFFNGRQLFHDVGDPAQGIDRFPLEIITVGGKEDLGLNLAEPVQDSLDAEIR